MRDFILIDPCLTSRCTLFSSFSPFEDEDNATVLEILVKLFLRCIFILVYFIVIYYRRRLFVAEEFRILLLLFEKKKKKSD